VKVEISEPATLDIERIETWWRVCLGAGALLDEKLITCGCGP
jgi:hypothetical protein